MSDKPPPPAWVAEARELLAKPPSAETFTVLHLRGFLKLALDVIEGKMPPEPEAPPAREGWVSIAEMSGGRIQHAQQLPAVMLPLPTDARDGCQFCLGHKGGTPGNENIVRGMRVCDYCSVLLSKLLEAR